MTGSDALSLLDKSPDELDIMLGDALVAEELGRRI